MASPTPALLILHRVYRMWEATRRFCSPEVTSTGIAHALVRFDGGPPPDAGQLAPPCGSWDTLRCAVARATVGQRLAAPGPAAVPARPPVQGGAAAVPREIWPIRPGAGGAAVAAGRTAISSCDRAAAASAAQRCTAHTVARVAVPSARVTMRLRRRSARRSCGRHRASARSSAGSCRRRGLTGSPGPWRHRSSRSAAARGASLPPSPWPGRP